MSDPTPAQSLRFVATVPRGLADLAAQELAACGAQQLRERAAGVMFEGVLETGYRACLWSRVASRVLLQLAQFEAATEQQFHAAVRAMDWRAHIDPVRTLACEFTGTHPQITHSHFGALRLKDGICDSLRDATGRRPDVALSRPAVRIHAHANGTQITLSLDLAGEGLHRRGYRQQAGEAPLRENVAAGMLLRMGWPQCAQRGGSFLDPMCGAGTLAIEAALMATERAPGLLRDYFGFLGWCGHDAALWRRLLDEARERAAAGARAWLAAGATPGAAATIRGSDLDARVLVDARANAQRAGVGDWVQFERADVAEVRPAGTPGLICTNPPYGVRLGDDSQAQAAYAALGAVLRARFGGWEAGILAATPTASRALQLRSYRTHTVWNGALECRLLRIDLDRAGAADPAAAGSDAVLRAADPAVAHSPGAVMFANRLGKNMKRLRREAQRQQASCYRLYDADMPEYAFAIDRYARADDASVHLYVQEYAAPASIDADAVRQRRAEVLAVLPQASAVAREHIHLRLRRRQSGTAQYQPLAGLGQLYPVDEAGLKFLVNFDDYLDTGLFLDHRLTRARLRAAAAGRGDFLNLFCYTASATVYAAAGGARTTTSVDLSNTYLDWAARNFRLNGLAPDAHRLERADCREWLAAAAAAGRRFDLVFLDPPTFSNSKRMDGVLDVQRDHAALVDACMAVLAPGGLLLFSTNAQRFRLDEALTRRYRIEDVSAATIPFDFARNPRIHRCFEIRSAV